MVSVPVHAASGRDFLRTHGCMFFHIAHVSNALIEKYHVVALQSDNLRSYRKNYFQLRCEFKTQENKYSGKKMSLTSVDVYQAEKAHNSSNNIQSFVELRRQLTFFLIKSIVSKSLYTNTIEQLFFFLLLFQSVTLS